MSEPAWIASLTGIQLAEWLKTPRTDAPFAILERIDTIDFPGSDEAIVPEAWLKGRIFGPAFELRWELRGEVYHSRLIGDRAVNAPFTAWPGLTDAQALDVHCYVWGKDEMRIGRRLEYRTVPDGQGRLSLGRREFRRRRDGALIADRFTWMQWEV